MTESGIYYRNKVINRVYKQLLKPIFFHNDPEFVHDKMTSVGIWLGNRAFGQRVTKTFFNYENKLLNQKILGIDFKNPVGLSAGFDKNVELSDILPYAGFGFAEVGSITGEPCEGNQKPRLWRLPDSKSLVVYYGLKNNGCENIAKKIKNKKFNIPIGVSVAMTNCKKNENVKNAVLDYAKAFKTMEPFASYITVNISCPNTWTGQPFIEPHKLDYLFDILDEIKTDKPVFIKLSPDLNKNELDNILEVVEKHRIHGIICTNLTKNRNNPNIVEKDIPKVGGLSGKVVQNISDEMLSHVYRKVGKKLILIGSGGVFSAEDAYRKIRAGASLVQLITGMVFEGPQVISQINQGLVKLLKKDGFKNISEAVGADNV